MDTFKLFLFVCVCVCVCVRVFGQWKEDESQTKKAIERCVKTYLVIDTTTQEFGDFLHVIAHGLEGKVLKCLVFFLLHA